MLSISACALSVMIYRLGGGNCISARSRSHSSGTSRPTALLWHLRFSASGARSDDVSGRRGGLPGTVVGGSDPATSAGSCQLARLQRVLGLHSRWKDHPQTVATPPAPAVCSSPLEAGQTPPCHRVGGRSRSPERCISHVRPIAPRSYSLRCSKTHVSHVLAGKVSGLPRLTHIAMRRRKLVRREWLEQWMEANRIKC